MESNPVEFYYALYLKGHEIVKIDRESEARLSLRAMCFGVFASGLILLTNGGGLLLKNVYTGETNFTVAQVSAQDWVHIVIVLPLLLITSVLIKKGGKASVFVWLGTMMYLVHSSAVYCFAIDPNVFFIGYCTLLALSVYGSISVVAGIDGTVLSELFDERRSNTLIQAFLWVLLLFLSSQWLKDIAYAIAGSGGLHAVGYPDAVRNITHALDLSLFLPGMATAAVLLRRRHPAGYVLAPVFTAFSLLYIIEMGTTVVQMKNSDPLVSLSSLWLFAALAFISYSVLHDYLTHMKHLTAIGA